MNGNDIIIIGGGPAGMMAAISASKNASGVTLVEKTHSLGNKLLLTGNGRCNLTNICNLNTFLGKFSKNGQFLRNAFNAFPNTDVINFFEEHGLKCTTESGEKVFPITDKAKNVLDILKNSMHRNNVTILYNSPVQKILSKDQKISGIKLKNGKTINAGEVILATGGLSYPLTGSTGDGFKMAHHLGHTIIPTGPALVPLIVKEKYPKQLMGLSLQNIALKIVCEKRKISSSKGDLLFTRKGLSGPIILSISGLVSELLSKGENIHLILDQFPETPKDAFSGVLKSYFKMHSSKSIKNNLKTFIPQKICDLFLNIAQIDPTKKSNQATQKEILSLSSLCKEFSLSVSGTSPIAEAIITRGGIALKEIDPRTMSSRLIKGLYFAGEIIDLDGDTGGFNLQEAFSTGYLAGKSASA